VKQIEIIEVPIAHEYDCIKNSSLKWYLSKSKILYFCVSFVINCDEISERSSKHVWNDGTQDFPSPCSPLWPMSTSYHHQSQLTGVEVQELEGFINGTQVSVQ
jgi:hypothetical protein